MSDYMPEEVILKILNRLPVRSLLRFRSVCKSWNILISHPSFISAHLQSSLTRPPNNTSFLLLGCSKKYRVRCFLHYDNAGFGRFKRLKFPNFDLPADYRVVGSCNGLLCLQLSYYGEDYFNLVLWNPSIQKYIYLPHLSVSEDDDLNVGFGFDSRNNDYKVLVVGVDKGGSWIQPYLFSLNGNCSKRVTAIPPNYDFGPDGSLPFVSGAVHWLGYQKRNAGEFNHAILGFHLSSEEFLVINLPECLTGFRPLGLSIMKYGVSSIALSIDPGRGGMHELWVMKEYGVVESWTKVLALDGFRPGACIPRVLGFRKNGEVLLQVGKVKMASLDLNSQQTGDSLYLNSQQIELHGVDVGANLPFLYSYAESLVLLDKADDVSRDSDYYHHIYSSDSDELSGGESDVNLAADSSDSDELSGGESNVNLARDSSGSDELSGGESDVNLPSDSSGSDESSGGESDLA
ncbi:hypothetical protein HRI_004887300 [Hibiscus trionum]|uniref:F-box domain-containing protein n=1 Tax=Hibiscus trionum TaxID=183268 RepID=A0A9W7JCS9_HIBTR|nr:hypothetical protein HRI_004887300 [Hibiscus trionum]